MDARDNQCFIRLSIDNKRVNLYWVRDNIYASRGDSPKHIYIGDTAIRYCNDKHRFILHGTGEYISSKMNLKGTFINGLLQSGMSATEDSIYLGTFSRCGMLDGPKCTEIGLFNTVRIGEWHLGNFVKGKVYDHDGSLLDEKTEYTVNRYFVNDDATSVTVSSCNIHTGKISVKTISMDSYRNLSIPVGKPPVNMDSEKTCGQLGLN